MSFILGIGLLVGGVGDRRNLASAFSLLAFRHDDISGLAADWKFLIRRVSRQSSDALRIAYARNVNKCARK